MNAVGVHVFAGWQTYGFREAMTVCAQLESHGFGLETASSMGILTLPPPWPQFAVDVVFGNPRCTGFSSLTSRLSGKSHGAAAKQNIDIWDLCKYALSLKRRPRFVVWESVCGAYTTGRALVEELWRDYFRPKRYRLLHLFVNAATFNNAQKRRRYFFIAYLPDSGQFWPSRPALPERQATVWDRIQEFRYTKARPVKNWDVPYDKTCYKEFKPEPSKIIPYLQLGWSLTAFAKRDYDTLAKVSPKYADMWDARLSDIPFGLYTPYRIYPHRHSPTMHSGARCWVHPFQDRGFMLQELAAVMGVPVIPRGENPVGQIVKGVVPAVAEWLARAIADYGKYGASPADDDRIHVEFPENRVTILDMRHYVPGG